MRNRWGNNGLSLKNKCCCSVAKSCSTLCHPMHCSTPGFPVLHYLLEFAQIHVHWVGDDHLILYCPFLLFPSIFPNIRVFFNEVLLWMKWPNYLEMFCQWTESFRTQLCLTPCDPMDCSPPGSSVHGILQARILEWVAIPFSRGSSQLRNWTKVSCIVGKFFTTWATTLNTLF